MPRLRLVLVGAALAAVCLAGMVSAATMQAIYRGTVSSGVDGAGLLGAGQDLTGLGFKAVFIYDTDTPGATRETTPNSDAIFGGTGPGGTSPMRSASLTINKHAQFVHPQFLGDILTERSAISHNGVFLSPDEADQVAAFADSSAFLFPTSLGTPVSAAALTPIGGGIFFFNSSEFPAQTDGSLATKSLHIAPIPLPATVPLLASGLAAFGFFAFRCRAGVRRAV